MTQYLELPGSNAHNVSTPDVASFDFATDTDLTVEVWAKLTDVTPAARQHLIGHNPAAYTTGWSLYLEPAGTLVFRFHDGANNSLSFTTPGLVSGQLHHIAVTHDFSGDNVVLYVGGVAHGTVGHPGATTAYTANALLMRVGSDGDGTQATAGDIYAAVIAQGVATQPDIAAAAVGVPAAGTTVIGHFNAGDFTVGDSATDTAVDSTGKTWTINGANSEILDDTPVGSGLRNRLLLGVG